MNRKKYYKPSLFILIVVIILVVLTTGCVSQKKYDSALQEIARLSVDSTFQEYQISDVKYQKQKVISNQQEELATKSAKLDSIQSVVVRQQNELRSRKDLINKLRNADWIAEEAEGNLVIKLKDDVVFQMGKSGLSNDGKSTISSIAVAMQQINEPFEIWVVGHTDNQPYQSNKKDNWDLSAERALAVVRDLIRNEIEPAIITASAKSKYDPASS